MSKDRKWIAATDNSDVVEVLAIKSCNSDSANTEAPFSDLKKISGIRITGVKNCVWLAPYASANEASAEKFSILCCYSPCDDVQFMFLSDKLHSHMIETSDHEEYQLQRTENKISADSVLTSVLFTSSDIINQKNEEKQILIGTISSEMLSKVAEELLSQTQSFKPNALTKESSITSITEIGTQLLVEMNSGGMFIVLSPTTQPGFLITRAISCERGQSLPVFPTGRGRWIFLLKQSPSTFEPLIDIWDLADGKLSATVNISSYFHKIYNKDISSFGEYTGASVSTDLRLITIFVKNNLLVLDLDYYFSTIHKFVKESQSKFCYKPNNDFKGLESNAQRLPPYQSSNRFLQAKRLQKLSAKPLRCSPKLDIIQYNTKCHSCSFSSQDARWFQSYPFQQTQNEPKRPWIAQASRSKALNGFSSRPAITRNSGMSIMEKKKPEDPKPRIKAKTKSLLPEFSIISLDDPTIRDFILHTYKLSESGLIEDFEIHEVTIRKGEILVSYKSQKSRRFLVCVFNRNTQSPIKVHRAIILPNNSSLVKIPSRSFYFIRWDSVQLCAWFWNQTEEQILQNLILFGKLDAARSLCALNSWKEEDLPLYSLHLGIQHKQIDIIPSALKAMQETHWQRGISSICKFLFSNASTRCDDFYKDLVELTEPFLITILRYYHNQVFERNKNDKTRKQEFAIVYGSLTTNNDPILEANQVFDDKKLSIDAPIYFRFFQSEFQSESDALLFFSHVLRLISSIKRAQTSVKILEVEEETQQELSTKLLLSNEISADYTKYESLGDLDIIHDSLLNGNTTVALHYLSVRQQGEADGKIIRVPWQSFVYTATAAIYQTITQFKFTEAYQKLIYLGVDAQKAFREVFLFTSRRRLRAELFKFMQSNNNFVVDPIFSLLVEWDNEIASHYPNPYFALEYMKKKSVHQRTPTCDKQLFSEPSYNSKQPSKCRDIADMPIALAQRYQIDPQFSPAAMLFMEDENKENKEQETSESTKQSLNGIRLQNGTKTIKIDSITDNSYSEGDQQGSGYAHYTLSWLKEWPQVSRDLILIDQNSAFDSACLEAQLLYLITRDDIKGFRTWIGSIIDSFEELEIPENSFLSYAVLCDLIGHEIIDLLIKYYPIASPTLREVLLNEFGATGVFIDFLFVTQENCLLLRRASSKQLLFDTEPTRKATQSLFPREKLNFYHRETLRNLEVFSLPHLVQEYISRYDLQKTLLKEHKVFSQSAAWFRMICFIQNPNFAENLLQASFANASVILFPDIKEIQSVEILVTKMIEQNKPWMLLGSILFSGVSVENFLSTNLSGLPHVCSKFYEQLERVSPSVAAALQSYLPTKHESISLASVWQHIWQVFTISSTFDHSSSVRASEWLKQNEESENRKNFFISVRGNSGEEFEDKLDIEYYLCASQPAMAYQFYCSDENELDDDSQISLRVWNTLLRHIDSQSIANACLMLLELLGTDSRSYKINFLAARRIFAHWDCQDTNTSNELKEKIKSLCGSLGSSLHEEQANIDEIFSLLCAATQELSDDWYNLNEHPLHVSSNPWQVVAGFSHLHGLPIELSHLESLLVTNQLATTLFYCQSHEVSHSEVATLIGAVEENSFSSFASYIRFVLSRLLPSQPGLDTCNSELVTYSTVVPVTRNYQNSLEVIFHHLVRHPLVDDTQTAKTGLYYMQQAYLHSQNIFILLASQFTISWEIMFSAWLFISFHSSLDVSDDDRISEQIIHCLFATGIESTTKEANSDVLHLLHDVIITFLSTIGILPLLHVLSIISPTAGVVPFFLFYRSFLDSEYEEAEHYIALFQDYMRDSGTKHYEWYNELTNNIMEKMLSSCETLFERKKLLSIASRREFSDCWKKRYSIFLVLQRCKLSASLDSTIPEIIEILIDREMFLEARELCHEYDISPDHITILECYKLLRTSEKRKFWAIKEERMDIWKQLQGKLQEFKCTAAVTGEFFFAMALRYRTAPEHVFLLEQAKNSLENVPESKRSVNRSSKFFDDLRVRIIILHAAGDSVLSHDGWDFDDIDEEVLHNVIHSLLDSKDHKGAQEISERFNITNQSLLQVTTALKFVKGELKDISQFPEVVQRSLLVNRTIDELKQEDTSYLLKLLMTVVTNGKELIQEISTQYKVAKIVKAPYERVNTMDHYSTLKYLIQQGRQYLDEARDYIELFHMNESRVTLLLANTFFQAIQRGFGSYPTQNIRRSVEGVIAGGVNPFQSVTEFGEFVSIIKEPKFIGDRFVHLYQNEGIHTDTEDDSDGESLRGPTGDWPDSVKTELLVRAHQCYYVSGYLHGTALIISLAKKFIFDLTVRKEFKLLVRLLTGIHNYIELHEIFNILMENDSFELLLRKDILKDPAEQVELRLAIFRYLQSHHPKDTSKLDLLYISFKMYRERAEGLFHKAEESIRQLGNFDVRNPSHSQILNTAVVSLLDASDCYAKEKCFLFSKRAMDLACLVSIQLKEPNLQLLNLITSDGKKNALLALSSVEDARDFAEAYDMNYDVNWLECLYSQVIVHENFAYLNDFLLCFPVTPALWVSMTEKFKADPQIANRVPQFKHFLSYLDDQFVRYKLAGELGFQDLQPVIDEDLFAAWNKKSTIQ